MDAAQIEAMNKVRASLGLAPLPVPGATDSGPSFKDDSGSEDEGEDISTLDKRQALADSNWQRLEQERKDKADREKRKAAAKKARDAAARFSKLEGKGLGDEDEGAEMDTKAWLLGQKKRQKKIDKARKLEEELAARERDEELQQEYTSRDLKGVKVGHEAAEFDEITGEQVLTLKDTAIGEESEDDELENADLRAKEKLEERLKLKKKKPDYDPTEQEGVQGVLSKYDEEIDGKKGKKFTLDGAGNTVEAKQRQRDAEDEVKSKGVKISLDMLKDDAPVSDYVDPATIKVKKPKKSKKEKKTRQKEVDEDDIFPIPAEPVQADAEAMEVDGAQANGATASRKRALDIADDEDLQASLAAQRRQALKKRKKMDAAELARQMREEMPVDDPEADGEDGGLVLDETTEFVANLKKPEEIAEERARQAMSKAPHATADEDEDEDEDGDTRMQSYAQIADSEDRPKHGASATPATHDMTATGLEDEDTLSGAGTGAALAMLRKCGPLDSAESSANLAEKEAKRTKFLADKQHLIEEYDVRAREQREADRKSGRLDRMSNRERDAYARQQNEARKAYIARLSAQKFNDEYRPDVKLQYHDEYGRSMNQKEAFKHLSHMFHGKGSGKQKTEKRLKKIEDEKREQGKGVLHAGEEGGFMNVQGREGKRQKQAGVRLQ